MRYTFAKERCAAIRTYLVSIFVVFQFGQAQDSSDPHLGFVCCSSTSWKCGRVKRHKEHDYKVIA